MLVHSKLEREQQRRREHQARLVRYSPYIAGDIVWLHRPVRKKGLSPKLSLSWEGPHEVIKVIGPSTYRISRLEGSRKRQVVHHDWLKPFHVRYGDNTVVGDNVDVPETLGQSVGGGSAEDQRGVGREIYEEVEFVVYNDSEAEQVSVELTPARYPSRSRQTTNRLLPL